MSTATAIQPAKVVEAEGRRWWRCANCNRTLGEWLGSRLVILIKGVEVKLRTGDGFALTCRHCGQENVLQ